MDGQPPRVEDRMDAPATPGMARQYATVNPDEPARRKSLVTGLVVGIICGGIVGGIAGAMLSNSYGYPHNSRQGESVGVPGAPPSRAVYGTNEGVNGNGNGKLTGDEVRKTTGNGYGTPLFPNMPAPHAASPGAQNGSGENPPATNPPPQPGPQPGSGGPQ